ncbi:MAG: FtsX-like permease family protein [Candidatus Nealsonbacteria bacterium]|nr:FtsX-like permease family protein [Candidatus Nealsonbacteria bacterium]
MINSVKRIIYLGYRRLISDGGQIFATIFILVITILLTSSLFLSGKVSQFLIHSLESKADISVYFKDTALQEDIFRVRDELARIPEVKEIIYISKDQALEEFEKRYKNNPVLMDSIKELGINPFFASLKIQAKESSQYQAIVSFLDDLNLSDIIEKIDYSQRQSVIERIFSITSFLGKTGILFSLILIIVAILITFNTIKLAIYNYQEEVKIQRLVGASNWFIRGPFLAQGAIAGIISALVSILVLFFVVWLFSSKIQVFLPDLNILKMFWSNFGFILLIQITTGAVLGSISSLIAIRKYLKI